MKTKTLKALHKVAQELNCTITSIEHTKHNKVKIDGPHGSKILVTLSSTPKGGESMLPKHLKTHLKQEIAKNQA